MLWIISGVTHFQQIQTFIYVRKNNNNNNNKTKYSTC